jgi:putative endopeptidase
MKTVPLLMAAALVAVATGCKPSADGKTGLDMANLDTTAIPGVDFYQFATGGWQQANPLTAEYSRFGSFDKLAQQNIEQIHGLIETISQATNEVGTVDQKIGDLYKLGMDSVRLNQEGVTPLKPLLDQIQQIKDKQAYIDLTASLRPLGVTPFFGFYIGADDKNSTMNILHMLQAGLGLGERDYYLENDEATKAIREGYRKLIVKQFVNVGFSEAEGVAAANSVLKLETGIAQGHYPKEKTRISELNYHKVAMADLSATCGSLDWVGYFKGMGIASLDSLNVGQPEAISAAVALLNSQPLDALKAYLTWQVIDNAASYLSDVMVNTNFDFYGRQLSGAQELRPRWKRTVGVVDGSLGEALGQLYVEKYFPASSKKRMLELVKNLQTSLGERIDGLEWMSDETKAKAQEKLAAFKVKIGYPDKWRDYSALSINPQESYLANVQQVMRFDYQYNLDKLGKPVDKDEWFMSPQTVNAYYNPSSNEICFPAGILQPPFFYANGDDAINYGAIGVVIGHEMTHGFDDQGRKFDKEGNMFDWWTAEDAARFDERSKVLVNYFDSIRVLGDVRANGTYTLGENIADHGGLQISYNAFIKTKQGGSSKPIDGYTPQQRFFLAYANVWAGNIRDEEILRLTKLDVHSLGKWRVNGALPHINAWYEAFNIGEDSPMFLPVDQRASIW